MAEEDLACAPADVKYLGVGATPSTEAALVSEVCWHSRFFLSIADLDPTVPTVSSDSSHFLLQCPVSCPAEPPLPLLPTTAYTLTWFCRLSLYVTSLPLLGQAIFLHSSVSADRRHRRLASSSSMHPARCWFSLLHAPRFKPIKFLAKPQILTCRSPAIL